MDEESNLSEIYLIFEWNISLSLSNFETVFRGELLDKNELHFNVNHSIYHERKSIDKNEI